MKLKIIAFLIGALCTYTACKGQHADSKSMRTETYSQSDNSGTWTVRKTLDNDGRVLSYDSSFTDRSYSAGETGKNFVLNDSLFSEFRKSIKEHITSVFGMTNLSVDYSIAGHIDQPYFFRPFRDEIPEINDISDRIDKIREHLNNRFRLNPSKESDEENEKAGREM